MQSVLLKVFLIFNANRRQFINISINKEVKKIWRLFGDREGFSKIRKRVNGGDRRANTRKKRLRRINTISHPNDDEE